MAIIKSWCFSVRQSKYLPLTDGTQTPTADPIVPPTPGCAEFLDGSSTSTWDYLSCCDLKQQDGGSQRRSYRRLIPGSEPPAEDRTTRPRRHISVTYSSISILSILCMKVGRATREAARETDSTECVWEQAPSLAKFWKCPQCQMDKGELVLKAESTVFYYMFLINAVRGYLAARRSITCQSHLSHL